MQDWNVVVTVQEHGFVDALRLLEQFGPVGKTKYYNVLVMKVEDVPAFLTQLAERDAALSVPAA